MNAASPHPILYLCWLISMVATLGSLFFSEVMLFLPCVLCWYQRIAMYPLVLLFAAAIVSRDTPPLRYTLPLTAIGWLIAIYHLLLHYGIVPETASPCVQGIPCSTVYINWYGFVTIPFLSFCAFSLLIFLQAYLFFNKNSSRRTQ